MKMKTKKNMSKNKKPRRRPVSKSDRAGIEFGVARCARKLRKGLYAERISVESSITMAAVLEYVLAELLEQTLMYVKDAKKKRITAKFVRLAVNEDEEFTEIWGGNSNCISVDHRPKKRYRDRDEKKEGEGEDEEEEEYESEGEVSDNGKTQK